MNQQIFRHLRQLGCDVDGALERLINDEQLYVTCLKTFATDENFDLLRQALAKQDTDAAFACAHTLKGVSANLGLTPLFLALCDLVEALRVQSCQDKKPLIDQVDLAFSNYLAAISCG